MHVIKRFPLFFVLTVLVSAAGIFASAADAQTIHYLQVIMESHPMTGNRHKLDGQAMQGLMQADIQTTIDDKIPTAAIRMSGLLSSDQDPAQLAGPTLHYIMDWIKNLQLGSDDVVFIYFSGHGGADKTETKDMYIALQGQLRRDQRFYRKEIVEALEGLDCRLKILITEASSTGPPVSPPGSSDGDVPLREKVSVGGPISIDTALHNLFFEHEGFLNISSASEGESAFGENGAGSYFTKSLVDAIYDRVEFEYTDFNPQDGFVSWSEVFELTKEATMEMFEKNKKRFPSRILERMQETGQTTQTPKYFGELPKRFVR